MNLTKLHDDIDFNYYGYRIHKALTDIENGNL